MSKRLPEGFEALEYFVDRWAVEGTFERDARRGDSTEDERVAFFEATKGLVPQALEMLDRKPLSELNEKENRLLNMLLSFCHVSMAVEMLGKAEPRHATFRKVMPVTRSPADVQA